MILKAKLPPHKQTVIKEYGKWSDETIKKAKQFMEGEVKEYDDYLCGENYR